MNDKQAYDDLVRAEILRTEAFNHFFTSKIIHRLENLLAHPDNQRLFCPDTDHFFDEPHVHLIDVRPILEFNRAINRYETIGKVNFEFLVKSKWGSEKLTINILVPASLVTDFSTEAYSEWLTTILDRKKQEQRERDLNKLQRLVTEYRDEAAEIIRRLVAEAIS